jgi:hypothetical protein
MNNLHTCYLCFFLLFASAAQAQKNAPVIGDAAKMVDLLKKDYNAIDPETRNEEIIRDRALVIATFKGYAAKLPDLKSGKDKSDAVALKLKSIKAIKQEKIALDATNYSITPKNIDGSPGNTTQSDIQSIKNQIKAFKDLNTEIESRLATTQSAFVKAKFDLDVFELEQLKRISYPDNKYVGLVIQHFIDKYTQLNEGTLDSMAAVNYSSSVQKSIPFLGGDLAFETVIDGLSRFLAKRIKEELTNSVIRQIQDQLNNPPANSPLNELKVLLPRTAQYLSEFQADQVTNFTNEIKQYIEDDLNHLMSNAGNLRNTPRFKKLLQQYPDIDFAFEALDLIPQLATLKQPIDYFDLLTESKNISRWKNDENDAKFNLSNLFYLADMLAHSAMIVDNGQTRFANTNFLSAYSAESDFYLLYVGLLYQQDIKYFDIKFKKGTSPTVLSEKLKELMDTYDPVKIDKLKEHKRFFETVLGQMSSQAEIVYNSALEIQKANKAGANIGADTAHIFIESVINLTESFINGSDTIFQYLNNALPRPNHIEFKIKEKSAPYLLAARAMSDIYYDLHKKKYATALLKTLELATDLIPENGASNITILIQDLNGIGNFEVVNNWAIVLDEIIKTPASGKNEFNSKRKKEAFAAVLKELNLIKAQASPAMSSNMTKIIKFVLDATVYNEFLGSTNINDILKSPEFKQMVISYYCNNKLTKYKTEIWEAYLKLGLSSTDVIYLNSVIDNLVERIYDYYFLEKGYNILKKDDRTARKNLQMAQKTLTLYAANYLAGIPQAALLRDYPIVTKLIHFLNDMALAENAEDVEKAIDAIALPSGSYAIKRTAHHNISINSYPGILAGGEMLTENMADVKKYSFSTGFTAPVGLSWTWGTSQGRSFGVFLPVIDIVAMTRLHIDETGSTQTIPNLKFENIFSPGVYFHWGLRKTPVSIHVGCQYAPRLRQIPAVGDPVYKESVLFGAGLVLDIPLLNLHTKPRIVQR